MKVGRDTITVMYKGKSKRRKFSYLDIPKSLDGWIDAKQYLPLDFDLVDLKTDTKNLSGWSNGEGWDGIFIRDKDRIKYWKRKSD